MKLKNYAYFICATENFIPYLNAFLNSIQKRKLCEGCYLTVYIFHNRGFNERYLQAVKTAFDFKVIPVEINDSDINFPTGNREFIKRVRYAKMIDLAETYDAVAFFDADMFIVSDRFNNLLDAVSNTDLLVGCNERFKWNAEKYVFVDGERIVKNSNKLYGMICNTPAIFDMKKWKNVFEAYVNIAISGREPKNGIMAGIGDLFCWNLAIYNQNAQDRVICFPIETMAQVHKTNLRRWTHVIVEDGYWRTFAGDRVYVIHNKIADTKWYDGNYEWAYNDVGMNHRESDRLKIIADIGAGLKAIQKEWYDLNFRHRIILTDYVNNIPSWHLMDWK